MKQGYINLGLASAIALSSLISVPLSAAAQTVGPTVLTVPAAGIPRHPKLSSTLNRLAADFDRHEGAPGSFVPRQPDVAVARGRVTIDIIGTGNGRALLRRLSALGLEQGSAYRHNVSGKLPIGRLNQLVAIDQVRFVSAAAAQTRAGVVSTQGDAVMNANDVRAQLGFDGTGVQVGILSDTFDCAPNALTTAEEDVLSGDLPATYQVIAEGSATSCANGIDEGRGMAQIIHDVAPGAKIAFHTAFEGIADFASGIVDLADHGAKVIVDDVGYFAEPYFQDGPIAQAVDEVTDRGVAYFSSAGNSASNSYEASFNPSGQFVRIRGNARPITCQYHDFDEGGTTDLFQTINTFGRPTLIASLQWQDPYLSADPNNGGANGNLDFLLFNAAGDTLLLAANSDNMGADPVEILGANVGAVADTIFSLAIVHCGGDIPSRVKYVLYNSGMEISSPPGGASTIVGHSNARGTMSVGASFWGTPDTLEGFSSRGGTDILFDLSSQPVTEMRDNPDFVAPDGGDTTFFFPGRDHVGDGNFPNFFGTSASAPHAAAVAALLLDKNGSLAPADIETLMEDTATAMPLIDSNGIIGDANTGVAIPAQDIAELTGAGALNALAALNLAPTPTCVLTATPPTIDFGDVFLGSASAITIQLRNDGTASCNNISDDASSPFALTSLPGQLPVNASQTITATFAPVAVGLASTTVNISADLAATSIGLTGQGESLPIPSDIADIAALISGPSTAVRGQTINLVIGAHNLGPDPATNVEVVLELGRGLNCTNCPADQRFTFGSLAGNSQASQSISVSVTKKKGMINSTAFASGAESDPNTNNNSAGYALRLN